MSNNKNRPLVSVITVVLNGENYLKQTIESVVNQTYDNIEYIVIDGGSSDNSVNIIKLYENKIAYWISEPDKGIYDAINKGLKVASGELIGILNSDDWYELDVIENIILKKDEISNYNNFSVLYCDYFIIDDEISKKKKEKRLSTLQYWKGMTVSHQAMFVSKNVYNIIGFYDLKYKLGSDYDYFLKMIKGKVDFYKLDYNGVNFRMGGRSSSSHSISLYETLKIVKSSFGVFSKIFFLFICSNFFPFIVVNLKKIFYKTIGRKFTSKLRIISKKIRTKNNDWEPK